MADKKRDEFGDAWTKSLDPATLRKNVTDIAFFVAVFEMFKDELIELPDVFYSDGIDEKGWIRGSGYEKRVLSSCPGNTLKASIRWFKSLGALTDADEGIIERAKAHRNAVTHEMFEYLTDPKKELDRTLFLELLTVFEKLEQWWVLNFEMAIAPDDFPDDVPPDQVKSVRLILLRLMHDLATGKEPVDWHQQELLRHARKRSD